MQRLFSATSKPSTEFRGLAQWISSVVAGRAKIFRPPVSVQASTAPALVSGVSSLASFARYDRATSTWKTAQLSLLEDSTVCSETWPRSGSMRSGTCIARATSARPMSGPAASSLPDYPTPSASSYGSSQNGINGKGGEFERSSAGTPSLETMARKGMFPTPTVGDSKRSGRRLPTSNAHPGVSLTDVTVRGVRGRPWSTPTTHDWKDTGCQSQEMRNSPGLGHIAISGHLDSETKTDGDGGLVLSPAFVEAMQGLPMGWTDVASWATASSHSKPSELSDLSTSDSPEAA